jgi:hypothetical protein
LFFAILWHFIMFSICELMSKLPKDESFRSIKQISIIILFLMGTYELFTLFESFLFSLLT